jgi:hypothetical protein
MGKRHDKFMELPLVPAACWRTRSVGSPAQKNLDGWSLSRARIGRLMHRHPRRFTPNGDCEPPSWNETFPEECKRAHWIVEEYEPPATDHRIEGVERQRHRLSVPFTVRPLAKRNATPIDKFIEVFDCCWIIIGRPSIWMY